ncbi:MAG: SusC/RagA family TonB-linked outer membrane protein, partial [Cytophagales bacterium]|nr:SusC/RagA family TonB-linked outer membrane protein [Cytophagales bacterium]
MLSLAAQLLFYSSIFAHNLFAQRKIEDVHVSINLQDVGLRQVLDEIESLTEFSFFYDEGIIDHKKRISLTIQNRPLSDVLGEVSIQTGLKFKQINEVISVAAYRPADDPQAQAVKDKITVKGKVTSVEDVQGLPGVNILIKGTSLGTVSDVNGDYSIEVPSSESVLVFRSMGFVTEEILVGDQSVINVELLMDLTALSEVVVVGYGTQEKVNVTGSVAAVKGREISEIPSATVSNTLAGRLPGLVVMNRSGEPGNDGADLSIRGFERPLVIVDGVEMDFSRLDPNDIESISVLKDASAAIFGARAGNGVIMVTTKRGSAAKTKVQVSTAYGYQGSTVYPEYVDAAQYMKLVNEYNEGSYSEEEIAQYQSGELKSTDWYAATFRRTAPMLRTNLNVSGGTDKARYFVSYGFLDQQSILNSGDSRYMQHNVRSNININLSKSLELRLDLAHRNEERNYPDASMENIMSNVAFSRPMFLAEFPDPSFPSHNGFSLIGPNYLSKRDVTGYRDGVIRNSTANIALRYQAPFVKGLTAQAFVNYTTDDQRQKNWKKNYDFYDYDPDTENYTKRVGATTEQITLNEFYKRSYRITTQFSLNYEKSIGEHSVKALLMNENIDLGGYNMQAGRQGFTNSFVDQLFASSAALQFTDGRAYQDARVSLIGRVNYSFRDKYLLEYTFRNDASPRFHEDYRWGFFPSISAGWRLSEENFMSGISGLDNMKLRASYGQSGYDAYD